MTTPAPQRILIIGVNWLGDAVMSMPALQAFRELHPTAHITLLLKTSVLPLWQLHELTDSFLLMESGCAGTLRTIRAVRRGGFDACYVLPHSFRSALIPFAARIPVRIGMPGHQRDWMLTETRPVPPEAAKQHQAFEYEWLLNRRIPESPAAPVLHIPEALCAETSRMLATLRRPVVALLPGAARGPSKQWAPASFSETGRKILSELNGSVLLLGAPTERALCEQIEQELPAASDRVMNLAGKTDITHWMALLAACDSAVVNDSGGMHLAAAVGTPLVAIYGITDPDKTGPLGTACRILQKSDIRSRSIPRESVEARTALDRITPNEVIHELRTFT